MTLSEAALKYVGVKFRHLGRTENGMDCVGLLLLAARDCGYLAEGIPVYGREPRNGLLQGQLKDHLGKPVDRDPKPNDIVAMSLRTDGQISHVGIITKHPYGLGLCHTYGEIGRVVHQLLDDRRINQITEVYEWNK